MNNWLKGIASWRIGKRLYLSVPFTWLLPEALNAAKAHKGPVSAGGPAVGLMPDYLADVAEIGGEPPCRPLDYHNPLATFTTRGCPNACPFCAVPILEGDLKELADWPVRPMVCDNNLLAASRRHFDKVIDQLKALPFVDFNQGLDARRFSPHHARRIAELKGVKVRFAFDSPGAEGPVSDAINLAKQHGLKNLGIYVLIGFRGSHEEAIHRLETVRAWGIRPNPMAYQPLDALKKNQHEPEGWPPGELDRMKRYYSRLRWLEHIPYKDYKPQKEAPLLTMIENANAQHAG